MRAAKALQEALTADKDRQTLRLWNEVRRAYGVRAYYRNQAHNWWGWKL